MAAFRGGTEHTVTLNRDALNTPWGFRLQGGADFKEPLKITRVTAGTASEGQLHIGDVVEKINNQSTRSLAHEDAIGMIANAGGQITIHIIRGTNPPVSSRKKPGPLDEEEEVKIPTNKNLASLMKDSLSRKSQTGNFQQTLNSNSLTRPASDVRTKSPVHDVTSYLPRVTPSGHIVRRAGSSPRETFMRSQVRNTMLGSSSATSSGRSSPSSVLEMRPSGSEQSAYGVWTPPTQTPNAKLMHMQYNSPLNMYTPQNVADILHKTAGGTLNWVNEPKFYNDISESSTFKYVQELEGRRPTAPIGPYEQSRTIKSLDKWFDQHGEV